MGIKSLLGFGQARDKPVRNYSNGEYSFNFGRSTSGKSVNEMTAMQITAVYACVRILSEAIASLPIHVYYTKMVGRKWSVTTRFIRCSMMSQTRRRLHLCSEKH